MRDGDGDRLGGVAHRAALGDVGVADRLGHALFGLNFDDRGGQGGFAVVNVADGADIDVGFRSLKGFFCHILLSFVY